MLADFNIGSCVLQVYVRKQRSVVVQNVRLPPHLDFRFEQHGLPISIRITIVDIVLANVLAVVSFAVVLS